MVLRRFGLNKLRVNWYLSLLIAWWLAWSGTVIASAQTTVALQTLQDTVKIQVTTEGSLEISFDFTASPSTATNFNLQTESGQIIAPSGGENLQKYVFRSGTTAVTGGKCVYPDCNLPIYQLNIVPDNSTSRFPLIKTTQYRLSDEKLGPDLLKLLNLPDTTLSGYSDPAIRAAIWMLYHNKTFDEIVNFTANPQAYKRDFQAETEKLVSSVKPVPTPTVANPTPSSATTAANSGIDNSLVSPGTTPSLTGAATVTAASGPGVSPNGDTETAAPITVPFILLGLGILALILVLIVVLVWSRRTKPNPANKTVERGTVIPVTTGGGENDGTNGTGLEGRIRKNLQVAIPMRYVGTNGGSGNDKQNGTDVIILEPVVHQPQSKSSNGSSNGGGIHQPEDEVEAIEGTTYEGLEIDNSIESDKNILLKCTDGLFKGESWHISKNDRVVLTRTDIAYLSLSHFSADAIEPEVFRLVSSPHAMLVFDKNKPVSILDLNSSNGVFLPEDPRLMDRRGRVPLNERFTLQPNQAGEVRIRLGSLEMNLDCQRRTLALATGKDRNRPVQLPKGSRVIITRDDLVITPLIKPDPDDENKPNLIDQVLSLPHALLTINQGFGFKIRDLACLNKVLVGTLENPVKVTAEEQLKFGDVFKAGSSFYTVINFDLEKDMERLREVFRHKGYHLLGALGEGGMAQTFHFKKGNDEYAIKIPKQSKYHTDARYFRAWQEEVGAMRNLGTDEARKLGIVGIIERGIELGLPYIVMEYVDGITVKEMLANGDALRQGEALYVLRELLRAVQYVHEVGKIAHCDISDSNVMVDRSGKVRLTDFGVATRLNEQANGFGTRFYAAPEMRSKRGEITPATDIFALGVLTYKMLTKEIPRAIEDAWNRNQVDTQTGEESLRTSPRNLNNAETVRRITKTGEEILGTSLLTPILRRCLETDPARRYQTAALLCSELENNPQLVITSRENMIDRVIKTLNRKNNVSVPAKVD